MFEINNNFCELFKPIIPTKSFKKSHRKQQIPHWQNVPNHIFHFKNEGGQVILPLPASIQETRNVIYIITELKEGGRCLIGKTGDTVKDRFDKYLGKINRIKEVEAFYKDIRQHPEKFGVSILHHVKHENQVRWVDERAEDIDRLETEFVKYYRQQGMSMVNKRAGGGGGLDTSKELPSHYAVPRENLLQTAKKCRLVRTANRVKLVGDKTFLKSFEENRQTAHRNGDVFGAIYCFERVQNLDKNVNLDTNLLGKRKRSSIDSSQNKENSHKRQKIENGEYQLRSASTQSPKKQMTTRLVGLSGNVKGRLSTHLSQANSLLKNPAKLRQEVKNKGDRFYHDLAKYTEEFTVSILPVRYLNPAEASAEQLQNHEFFTKIGQVEDHAIKVAKAADAIYNTQMKGGGGTRARELCRRPLGGIKFSLED